MHTKFNQTMEKDNENILLKSRSSRACIRDGYHFYFSHFKRIFKTTWLIAIVFAVLSATASAMPVLLSPQLTLAGELLATLAVLLLLILVWRKLHKVRDNRTYPLQELVTAYRNGTHRRHRMYLHHIHLDHAHLAAYDHHDGSQLAGSDRCSDRRSQRHARLRQMAHIGGIPHRRLPSGLRLAVGHRTIIHDERRHYTARK